MKKSLIIILLAIISVVGSGCATIVSGKYQNIPVTSNPSGAKVRSDTGEYIITPGSFDLVRNKRHTLVAEFEGAEPQQKTLKNGVQGWFFGNIIAGGIIGGVVDMASGACDELKPKNVHFDFSQAGQIANQRRNNYISLHPDLSDNVKFAIQNGLTVKGMSKEEVIASLGTPNQTKINGNTEEYVYNGSINQCCKFKDGKLVEVL